MSPKARREYVREMQIRYQKTQKRKEKTRLLTQISETLICNRKHSIRLMKGKVVSVERPWRHRDKVYPERLVRVLESVWEAGQHPWSVRLKALLPLWLPWIKKRWVLSAEDVKQFLAMSPATMDRRLASYKRNLGRKIYGQTKPGRWLRRTIPIQTESWDVPDPGWIEADTVSHSGPSASGIFANTLTEVDLFSGWVEAMAVLGKRSEAIVTAAEEIRQAMPFDQKGLDTDNGEEFINYELDRYCHDCKIQRFRSRPYKKDDQAHIEQKNGTHVRRLIGWDRYDTDEAVAAMNSLYRQEWRWLTNLFLPSVKLAEKIRIGSRIKRVYGKTQTPLDRLLESGKGDRAKLEELRKLRDSLDPFELALIVDKKLEAIWKLASKTRIKPAASDHVLIRPKTEWWKRWEYNPPAPLSVPFANMDLRRIRKQWYQGRLFGTN